MSDSSPSRTQGPLALAGASLLFVVLYIALDAATFLFPYHAIPVTPWNPNAGLAVTIVIVGGRRYAFAAIIGPMASEILLYRASASLPANFAAGAALGAAYVLTALAVRRFAPLTTLEGVRDLRVFLVVVAAGTAASAACYVAFNVPVEGLPASVELVAFLRMWLGDLTGTVGTVPLLLLIARRPGSAETSAMAHASSLWLRDIGFFILVLVPLLVLIFGIEPIEGHKLFYLLFVPLIVLAMARGLAGAAVGVVVVQIALIVVLLATDRTAQTATEFQLLMLVLAVTTLLLGVVVSERRRALEELARSGAELRRQQSALGEALRVAAASEMASALAHELAQPLSAIGTYARAGLEMLRSGNAAPEDLARALERVESETARSGATVHRIREFFRSGTSSFETMLVSTLIAEAVTTEHDRIEARGVNLQVEIEPDMPGVFVDKIQIGTVLHNLINNALDAAAEAEAPDLVRISATCLDATSIAIDVADSGAGVASSVRTRLFEPLATTKPTGMGLGLAISRTIVQAHGGELWLARERPTTFRITLPIHVTAA